MRQGETKKISIPKRGGAVIIIYVPRKIKFSTSSANKADNNRENSNGRENSRQNSRESSVDTTTSSSYNGSNPDFLRNRAEDLEMTHVEHETCNEYMQSGRGVAAQFDSDRSSLSTEQRVFVENVKLLMYKYDNNQTF